MNSEFSLKQLKCYTNIYHFAENCLLVKNTYSMTRLDNLQFEQKIGFSKNFPKFAQKKSNFCNKNRARPFYGFKLFTGSITFDYLSIGTHIDTHIEDTVEP